MDPPECQMNPSELLQRAYSASTEKASYRPTRNFRRKSSSAAAAATEVYYTLEDPARPSDVNIFQSVDEHVAAVEQLKEDSYCFILRSDFRFTYALVLKQEDGVLELKVTEHGGTKSIPKAHWKKYIRTLIPDSPKKQHPGGHHYEESRHHREQHDAPVNARRSYQDGGYYEGSQSEYIHHERSQSSGSSSGGLDCRESLRKFSFSTDFKRSVSIQDDAPLKKPSKQVISRHRRRVTIGSSHERPSTTDFKRSVSTQEDVPLKKCYKHGHHNRSQSECGHYTRSQSSGSDDSSSSLLDSSLDNSSCDSSRREDSNKLLTKSMPSLHQTMESERSLRGAFGDVTKIEILD